MTEIGEAKADSGPLDSVGIITRTLNRPLLLRRALESVLAQRHENWLHIIVNDGGDVAGVEACLAPHRPRYGDRLRVIHHPASVGMAAAFNVGLRACHTAYVVAHDDDDSWAPEFLCKSIAALKARQAILPNTRGIACHATVINERLEGDRIVDLGHYSFNGWLRVVELTRLAAGNFIPPISFLLERSVLDEIGFFNEAMTVADDWEFYLRFISRFEIAVLPDHLANYHLRLGPAGQYGNTITAGIDRHLLYGASLRNELVRRDLDAGRFGIGTLMALRNDHVFSRNFRHGMWLLRQRLLWKLKSLLGKRGRTRAG